MMNTRSLGMWLEYRSEGRVSAVGAGAATIEEARGLVQYYTDYYLGLGYTIVGHTITDECCTCHATGKVWTGKRARRQVRCPDCQGKTHCVTVEAQ